jgi:hypothetical protein
MKKTTYKDFEDMAQALATKPKASNKHVRMDVVQPLNITVDMMMNYIGSDQNPIDYLHQLITGEYLIEDFQRDVIAYEEESDNL